MDETTKTPFGPDSPAVQAHLSILQDVIRRMAGNSASCKNWCVVLVAAMLVLVARTETPDYALLAVIPTLLFGFLDAYYLAQEKDFIGRYNAFVGKIHDGSVLLSDLYGVRPNLRGFQKFRATCVAAASFSVWGFYGLIGATILLVWKFDCIRALIGW